MSTPSSRAVRTPVSARAAPQARYARVKEYIRSTIQSGAWRAGDRIPSELNLVDTLGVSRMTINRALRELTDEGLLKRLSGVGTFVAEAKPQSTLLMIADIGDEIRSRGHEYSCSHLNVTREAAPAVVSGHLEFVWIYLTGPVVGAGLSVPCWYLIRGQAGA